GPARHPVRPVGLELDLHVRGGDPVRCGHPQHHHPQPRTTSEMTTADAPEHRAQGHLLQLEGVSKYFGSVIALTSVSLHGNAGEGTWPLGDNGAGKSALNKILSGVHQHHAGNLRVDGVDTPFSPPRDARHAGIATVYQDLAMVPLMSIWRNFFLGEEP